MYDGGMSELFQSPESADAAGTVVSVAVNTQVWREFDYLWNPLPGPPARGQRVYVPLGKSDRKTLGFVVDEHPQPAQGRKLKHVMEVVDSASKLDAGMLQLARWISGYYLSPLGMVLAAMIPSSLGRRSPKLQTVARLIKSKKDWPQGLGGRQKRALDELHEAHLQGIEWLALEELAHHSGATRDSIRRLGGRGLIELSARPADDAAPLPAGGTSQEAIELNEEQAAAMERLDKPLQGGFSVTLLHGVTGSGKTEVYIRAIRRVIDMGRQAILLVPEIALATQTLGRLIERLPRVAVLHSGLTSAARDKYYNLILEGKASVVVGPRSAIFAPTRKLGLIIVDEEHEPSYKQDTAPRYHGRDVAVMRGSIEGAPVLLGSATPSLESMHNARQGRYSLIELKHRVKNLPMPRLKIVPLRKELTPGRIELIGATLTHRIAATLDAGRQAILLMNRRGYASYVFCPASDWILTCEQCSMPMVYHQAIGLAMCHHCDKTAPLPACCPVSGQKLVLFGFGIQRIENELFRKFPLARVSRMDSDTMTSPRQFEEVFRKFSAGETDILLGTQIVAKGLDFPRVSLVGVVSADTSLAIPDFRSSERTFQLIVQVAGRAGRGADGGEVVVQTLHENEPAIIHAATHDYHAFCEAELKLRSQAKLPPFARMVRFIIRHQDPSKAQQCAEQLRDILAGAVAGKGVSMIGPMQAGVAKVKNMFRFHLLLSCPQAGVIQRCVGPKMEEAARIPAEIQADADPVNLL